MLCWSVRFALLRFLVFLLISQLAFRIFRCSSSWSVRFACLFFVFCLHLRAYVSHCSFFAISDRTFRIAFCFCFVLILERTFRIAVFLWFVFILERTFRIAVFLASGSVRFALQCFWFSRVSHCCVFVLVLTSSSVRLALLCFRLSAAAPGAAR